MRTASWTIPFLVLAPVLVRAQPVPAPATGDARCEEMPREDLEPNLSEPDSEGFRSLFNGVDLGGWWLNCRSSHSSGSTEGPIIRVDPERKAIYTTQRVVAGGVLMTKAKFMDYEVVFDYWPDWGNDAALQNRTDSLGRAYNTTLSYLPGASLGGVWGEAGLLARDYRPFNFASAESTLSIPGNGNGESSNWTTITRKLKAAGENVPCPETGCTQDDWRRLWNLDDWNQIRVVFRGGADRDDPIHARSWFRKPGAAEWVPLMVDTTVRMEMKPGYLGLMIHGGGRYGGPRGTWYRNIRWKPWTPPMPVAVRSASGPASRRPGIRVDPARRGVRLTFAETALSRDVHVFSLEGKFIAERRGIRGEAFLGTAGWRRGLYLLRVDEGGRRDWAQFLLP